jgi:hypothetical protein
MLLWTNRKSRFYTAQVHLYWPSKRELVYSDLIGSQFPSDWRKHGCGTKDADLLCNEYGLRLDRARSVATALGKAIAE